MPPDDVDSWQEVRTINPLVRQLWDEAWKEGWREGRQEVRVLMMVRVLTAKFGPLPDGVRPSLEAQAADAAWEAVEVRLPAAASLADVSAILQGAEAPQTGGGQQEVPVQLPCVPA